MSIFDFLKKRLKEKSPTKDIIPIHQLISLPTREDFIQDKRMSKLIDTYKSEYKNTLSQLKYLTSLDIHSKDLSQNMSMNIDLLLNIFMNENEVKQVSLQDKIDYLINIRKLNIYSVAIMELEQIVTARLIALNEIYNERKAFMPRYKKNALANEINNLSVALLLFMNKKLAIELEKKHYLTNAIYLVEKVEDSKEEERLIAKKRTLLLNMEQVLFQEDQVDIREDKEHILEDMAEVERKIEIYVYTHKSDVEFLRQQLEYISENAIDIKDKEKVLSALKNLEYKFLAFYKYGREYIAIEDLMQLYLIKFNVLVLSENGICETFVDENTTDIELDCYKGILQREIESFIKGEADLNNPQAIKIIINILKKNYKTLELEEILTDKYLLNVLLAMGSKEDLIHLLKNFKVKKKEYGYFDFCDEIFKWEEELPLETIYRLMLSQNIGYDAELYEYLQSEIYPDKDCYNLPSGLKAINYNVDPTIEEHWLSQNTLLTIAKMRELMQNKYIVCPSSLIRIKDGTAFRKKIPIKGILFNEGLEIPSYNFDNVEVLERDQNKITYFNNRTNEIITSDLKSYIHKKWGSENAAGLLIFEPDNKLYMEEYNSYEYGETPLERGQNAILARRNSETLLFSRAYVDVSTKYGDFCLHIEEKKTKNRFGPHVWLSLYHGHHEEIIDKYENDFNWPDYGIFRTKYMEEGDFYQWMLGFVDSVWSHPFRNIWTYGDVKTGSYKPKFPIYSFNEYQGTGKRGTILIDGNVKLKDSEEYLPDMFENIGAEEYERISCTSKAYFGTPSENIAILKYPIPQNPNHIKIIYKQKNRRTDQFETKCVTSIDSKTEKEFTENDFELIISALEEMPIHQDLKKFVIDEIKTYVSLSYQNNAFFIGNFPDTPEPINLSNVLEREGYDSLLDTIERNKAAEFVEKLIENISQNFHISISDLLYKNYKIKQETPRELQAKILKKKKAERTE